MGLHQLITLLYLSITLTFTCARRCDVTCPAGEYFEQQWESCRSCGELCGNTEESRVVDCNNLCRPYCNSVAANGDENTKCFSAESWGTISAKEDLPCSTCCVEDRTVCSEKATECEDCSSFCSEDDGNTKSCQGFCRDWCDKLKSKGFIGVNMKKYGLCNQEFPPLQLLEKYTELRVIAKEIKSEESSGSAEGSYDDDEDDLRGTPESSVVTHMDKVRGKVNSTLDSTDDGFNDIDLDGSEKGRESDETETTTKRSQVQPRIGTVVKREGSFNTQWLLWIIGGCAILLLLVNGILLAVMLKQRTKPPPENHQPITHTNRIYGTATAEEEKKKLISDVESQSSESMGGRSRSRCESEKTDGGDTDELSHVSEVGGDEGKDGEDKENGGDTESYTIYSYIEPEAARKAAAAGSSDVV